MKFGSKRFLVAFAALTAAWWTGFAVASSRADLSAASPASVHSSSSSTVSSVPLPQKNTPPRSMPIGLAPHFAQAAQAGIQAGAAKPQMSEEVYKNIKALRGIPVDEFLGTMGVFTTSLTLCCGNCHEGAGTAEPKWDADPPMKRTALRMIQMVQAINKQNFQGRQVVTCWTCHRGTLQPAVTAPLDFAYGETVVVPPDVLPRAGADSGQPTLDQILDKYVQAVGGAQRVNAITSWVGKGRSIAFQEPGEGNMSEIYAKKGPPNQYATFTHQPEGDLIRTYDGNTAYFQLPLTVTPQYPLTNTLREGAAFDAAMAFPWNIKGFFNNWKVSYPATIEGVETNVIQGNTPAGMIGTLYFDKQTGLLKRMIRYANTAVGRIPTQIDYVEFKPFNGVMMPTKFNYIWVSEREDWTMTDYQFNVAIDAARFAKPPEPKKPSDLK